MKLNDFAVIVQVLHCFLIEGEAAQVGGDGGRISTAGPRAPKHSPHSGKLGAREGSKVNMG